MTQSRTYSTREAAARIGLPVRTLLRYEEEGLVSPTRTPQRGGRVLLAWSERNLREAEICALLVRDVTLAMERVAPLMEQVRAMDDDELRGPLVLQFRVAAAREGRPLELALSSARDPAQTQLPLAS